MESSNEIEVELERPRPRLSRGRPFEESASRPGQTAQAPSLNESLPAGGSLLVKPICQIGFFPAKLIERHGVTDLGGAAR